MFGKPEIIESFYGEYKIGLLGKKNRVSLYVYEKMIDGTGAEYFAGKLTEHSFEIKYEQIKEIEEKYIEGNRCLLIEYLDTNTIVKNKIVTVVLPCLEKMEEAQKLLLELREKSESEKKKKQEEERAAKEQQLLEQKRYEEECQLFFKDCYNFHIADNNNPAISLGTSTLFSLYRLYIIVEQHPTGETLTDIGKSVDIPPILWWSIISTILACSIPSAL